jgi:hypothetical protein
VRQQPLSSNRGPKRLEARRLALALKSKALIVGDTIILTEGVVVKHVALAAGMRGRVEQLSAGGPNQPLWAGNAPLVAFPGAAGITSDGLFRLPIQHGWFEIVPPAPATAPSALPRRE